MSKNTITGMGQRIAELRRSNRMTQEELSDILNVSPKHISHVERDCASLSLYNLIQVSHIFSCSLDYIVEGRFNDEILDRMPEAIVHIMNSRDVEEQERLNRYLSIYSELYEKKRDRS